MALTAAEQYLLELVNRSRLDPVAEAKRYGVDLNDGLAAGTIDGSAKQAFAPNVLLENASQGHSEWMLANDRFSHDGIGGSDPGDRMSAAGYDLSGSFSWRENLAWTGTTGEVDLNAAVRQHHEGLYRSAGHRENTMANDVKEIGVAQVRGEFTVQGVDYDASMLTLNYAREGDLSFVTGVVFQDKNNDEFYSIGEGLSGFRFNVDGKALNNAAAGGYGIGVVKNDDATVVFSKGDSVLSRSVVDLSDQNVKVDAIKGADGGWDLAFSGDATLVSGIADAHLLGVASLSLTGSNGNNKLTGNRGDNVLSGGAGNDVLDGGGGRDILKGGTGDDVYLVNGSGSIVQEDASQGFDSVVSGMTSFVNNNSAIERTTLGDGGRHLTGSAGSESLTGDDARNVLSGRGGSDVITGKGGNDFIHGGAGGDFLFGGAGADTFAFNSTEDSKLTSADRIMDFSKGDKIDLSRIDADPSRNGDQAFSLNLDGTAKMDLPDFDDVDGGRITVRSGRVDTLIYVDADHDGRADMMITLAGQVDLTASDFIL